MKNYLFSLLLVLILFFSCKEDLSENLEPTLKNSRQTATITRNFNLKIANNPNPIAASVTVIIDTETEEIVNYYFSQSVLLSLAKTTEELDSILRDEMGDMYFLQEKLTKGAHADCMNDCRDRYTRGNGRGECRANCWIDTAIRILEAIGKFFS